MPREVASVLYDRKYYLEDCAGHEEFKRSGGKCFSPKHKYLLDLASIAPGARLLDIGSGRGEIVFHAARIGAEAVGIDYSEAAISLARERCSMWGDDVVRRVRFYCEEAQHMSFPDNYFDVIIMSDVVEHLYPEQLASVFAEVYRVLRPQGRVIIHTYPNRYYNDYVVPIYWRWVRLLFYFPAKWLTGKTLKLSMRSDSEKAVHVNEQTPDGLRRSLVNAGFAVKLWMACLGAPFRDISYGDICVSLAMSLWPLNVLPFFRDVLNTHIFAVAVKGQVEGKHT